MKTFLREHAVFIVLTVLQFSLLAFTFAVLHPPLTAGNLLYLFALTLFLTLAVLAWRLAANWAYYRFLDSRPQRVGEFTQVRATGALPRASLARMADLQSLAEREFRQALQEKQEHLDFLHNWVHQMKTPIAALHLIVQDHEDELPCAGELQQEIDRLQHSLGMVLHLSRIDSFHHDFRVEAVDLTRLAYAVVGDLRRQFIRRRIRPVVEASGEEVVHTDRKWLSHVLYQLLTNAIRYSGGPDKTVTIRIARQGTDRILSVSDEGVGIAPEDLPRVFDLYFTGRNGRVFGETTGIGLYLVRKICDALGHDLTIESEENRGTTVTIRFR